MILPSPKIVVIDDNPSDVAAIVQGFVALGTAALGFHYSSEVTDFNTFPCLRLLFLDLHLLEGAGSSDQQIKNTIGVLSNVLTGDNGPYVVVLWSSHVPSEFELFKDEVMRRLPVLGLPIPLQLMPLDKVDFIVTRDGKRCLESPEKLRDAIMERIRNCPQLAVLLSWEEDVSRAADDAIRQIFRLSGEMEDGSSEAMASKLGHVLGEIAVASVGFHNAKEGVFRGINDVLMQVVADRLQHRSMKPDTNKLWQEAVPEVNKDSTLSKRDAALLNNFLHLERQELLDRTHPWERGVVVSLSKQSDQEFTELWGRSKNEILPEFCIKPETMTGAQALIVEWIMVQAQPACDQAQRNLGLLPFLLGLRGKFSNGKLDDMRKKKNLWVSPAFP